MLINWWNKVQTLLKRLQETTRMTEVTRLLMMLMMLMKNLRIKTNNRNLSYK